MSRPLANSLRFLSVVLLAVVLPVLAVLTLSGACGSGGASRCTSSDQCAEGFTCNPVSEQCEVIVDFDAAPACPEATHFCATAAPAGWSGPVIGTEVASDAELAACPEAYSGPEEQVFGDFVAAGGCSCECPGLSSGVLCSNATVSARQGTSTGDCITDCTNCSVSLGTNFCQFIDNAEITEAPAVRISLGKVTNTGTCSAAITSDDLSAEFAEQARYCSADALDASCPAAGACLPNAGDESFDSVCIFQAGDNECPADYPAKRLRFAGIEDTRSCSECTCSGPAVDSSCGGAVSLAIPSDTVCADTAVTGGCVAKLANQPISARYAPETDFACTQSGAELSGEATATDPVTFCCLAPPL